MHLSDLIENISQGIKNTSDKIFMMKGVFKDDVFYGFSEYLNEYVEIESSIVKPVAKGKDIKRYASLDINYYQIYPHKEDKEDKTIPILEEEFSTTYPLAFKYLLQFKDLLIETKIRYKTNPLYWYSLHRSRELQIFNSEKIVSATIQNYPHFTLDFSKSITDAGGYCMILSANKSISKKELLGLLNSKVLWFFIKNTSSVYRGGYYAFNTSYLNPFPLPELKTFKEKKIEFLVDFLIENHTNINNIGDKFTRTCERKFEGLNLTKKLQDWYNLSYKDFIKELTKQKIKLTLSEEAEWADYFDQEKSKALEIQTQITATDKEIDQMVYELYGLSEEEIKIIEEN